MLLSSYHHDESCETSNLKKPTIIKDYNAFKGRKFFH
jgi:hypothetical protein